MAHRCRHENGRAVYTLLDQLPEHLLHWDKISKSDNGLVQIVSFIEYNCGKRPAAGKIGYEGYGL
jgi:hypothetical protein